MNYSKKKLDHVIRVVNGVSSVTFQVEKDGVIDMKMYVWGVPASFR